MTFKDMNELTVVRNLLYISNVEKLLVLAVTSKHMKEFTLPLVHTFTSKHMKEFQLE
jgi:hypothetical protein